MKITGIETISLGRYPNVLWVEVHTDGGLVGLGETFFAAGTLHTYIHEVAAPQILGEDPTRIEAIAARLGSPYIGFKSTGIEVRAASAVDIALWDVLGQAAGQPLYRLLGGLTNERLPVYNTCAGYDYVKTTSEVKPANWGVDEQPDPPGPYEDLQAFLARADELAQSLLEEGYQGMKIWPFDTAALANRGTDISVAELKQALEPFEKVRAAVGDRIKLHVELHGMWQKPAAVKIAHALEDIDPYWLEDPIKMSSLDDLADYKRQVDTWVAASEVLGSRRAFRELFERHATDVCILDIGWTGGLTEAKAIAGMAAAYDLPIAPHDCTGPVLLTAAVHLSAASPNALVQEVVRAFYHGWYGEMVTALPPMEPGFIRPPEGPGLGTALLPDVKARADAVVRRSAL